MCSATHDSWWDLYNNWHPFGLLQMRRGEVYYMHDSTESTEDNFTLSLSAYDIDRRSLPFTISVTVIPVNDEPPKLTRNTGTEVILCSYERVIGDQFSHMLIKPEKLTYWNSLMLIKCCTFYPITIQADHQLSFPVKEKRAHVYRSISNIIGASY